MIGHDQIEYAALTDVGVRRSHNQDAHAALLATDDEQWRQRGHIFLVADGMGAHAVGELASEQAANIIPHTYHKHAGDGPAPALRKAFLEANTSIHERGQQNREFQGMGTTSTSLLLLPESAWLAHVGDSRAYRVREGTIEQLSFDHSLVWEMARRQKVDPDDLRNVPTNVIIRSLGPEAVVQVDVEGPHSVRPGDIFLLCSDGLSGQLSDAEIGAIVTALPPAEACRFLVDFANLRGGPDNITVIIVRVGGTAAPPPPPVVPLPEPPPPRPWHRYWPFLALGIGVALAIEAVLLAYFQLSTGYWAFGLAVAVLLIGLAGLAILAYRERPRRLHPAAPQPNVYRQKACAIDRAFVDRLAAAGEQLAAKIREKHWDADWPEHQRRVEFAREALGRDDLSGAFRETCRAVLPLAEAIEQHMDKEESFQPLWDKR